MAFVNQTVAVGNPQDTIANATAELDKFVASDATYDDLAKRVRVYNEQSPNDSGLNDHDYPSLSERIQLPPLPELSLAKNLPLPPELVQQFSRMQCNCMLGLFPEINRAWLTIDSDVYVWNYQTGGDLAYFDSLKETIITCGLVKPKKGTCPGIPHILVIVTPIDLFLLGVTFGDINSAGSSGDPAICDMNLLPKPLYTLPTDNTHFLTIQGTHNGRIFLGAKDGCLYEVVYQAEDSWFSKKCKLVNLTNNSVFSFLTPSFLKKDEEPIVQICIDSDRNTLYTRSEQGSIQVYDLGKDSNDAAYVADLSSSSVSKRASEIRKTVDKSNFENLVHIAPVSKAESVKLHLVAITASGVRLYFTMRGFDDAPGTRARMLKLVHVRLPPGFSSNTAAQRPSRVHTAHYNKGNLLMVASQSEENDLLWTINSDSFPFQSQLMESHVSMSINGHTWALTEEPTGEDIVWRSEVSANSVEECSPPLVVTQHMESNRRMVVLTTMGSYIFQKLRPVDQLRHLLISNQGAVNPQVEAFFKLHNVDQACASCLILICSQLAIDTQVNDWAKEAFFTFGGNPRYNFDLKPSTLGPNFSMSHDMSVNQGMSFQPAQVSTPHPNKFSNPANVSALGAGLGAGTSPPGHVVLSGKHGGIGLYLARILAPLWESRLAAEVKSSGSKTTILQTRIDELLVGFISQLTNLLHFLKLSSQFGFGSTLDNRDERQQVQRAGPGGAEIDELTKKHCHEEAVMREAQSLQSLMVLISRCIEVLNLWKIACDHQFEVVTKNLTGPQKATLKDSTLKQLLKPENEEVYAVMIDGIVKQYLGDNACTDVISAKLRELCPSLYSLDKAKCSKATELVQSVKGITSASERANRLNDAMNLYKEVSPNMDLQQICQELSAVRHYEGVLDICLTTAHKRDPQNIALYYYKNGEPSDDSAGYNMFTAREDSYTCVMDTLDFLLSTSFSSVNSTANVPSKPGSSVPSATPLLTAPQAEQHAEHIYHLALKCSDELFHVKLYEWMISKDLTDKLMQISLPDLEEFLRRKAGNGSGKAQLQAMELLWRYYEKNRNYAAAAKILNKLADKPSSLDLQQRLEYLSRAVISAKSASYNRAETSEGDLLHDLEEKLDVARVQIMILDSVKRLAASGQNSGQIQAAIDKLNTQLMDVTTLYGSYADPLDLAECKLAILHCAGHYDHMLIDELWSAIIEKEWEFTEAQGRDNAMHIIQNKIISLAKKFGTNDKYFPLGHIITQMEMRSLMSKFDDIFVVNTMALSQIPVTSLLRTYNKIYKTKDNRWQTLGREYHLLHVVAGLVESFTAQPHTLNVSDRSIMASLGADVISGYMVELQSVTRNVEEVQGLTAKLKTLQYKLQRL